MNKKGFISSTVVYSFFILFLLLLLTLLATYKNNRQTLSIQKNEIEKNLNAGQYTEKKTTSNAILGTNNSNVNTDSVQYTLLSPNVTSYKDITNDSSRTVITNSIAIDDANKYITYSVCDNSSGCYSFDESTGYYSLNNAKPTTIKDLLDLKLDLKTKQIYLASTDLKKTNETISTTNLQNIYRVTSLSDSTINYYLSAKKIQSTNGKGGLYKYSDNLYYFRGLVNNNLVRFGTWSSDDVYYGYETTNSSDFKTYSSKAACEQDSLYNKNCTLYARKGKDMYWRIISITSGGNIKMIYAGTDLPNDEGFSLNPYTSISKSYFNQSFNDNMYVGYKYTSGIAHGIETDSDIKKVLDNWYNDNLKNNYESYLAKNDYCNNRVSYTDSTLKTLGGGTGSTLTYYQSFDLTNNQVHYECTEQNDKFNDGYVGLITADEVEMAGNTFFDGNSKQNNYYYLYSATWYWTMTPMMLTNDNNNPMAYNYSVSDNGGLAKSRVDANLGVRPVITLNANVLLTGNGTKYYPYTVVGLKNE